MPTDLRNATTGERLIYIDGPVLRREPGGPRLAYIEEQDILDTPGGKRMLHLDGDDVRTGPGGPRLACWDAATLRMAPTLPALLVVDVRDIRTPDGVRKYVLEGAMPSIEQITAALFLLDPALFTHSLEEQAGLSVTFSSDPPPPEVDGAWRVVATSNAAVYPESCVLTVRGKRNRPWLGVSVQRDDGSTWYGVGVRHVGVDDRFEIVLALAPDQSAELGLLMAVERDRSVMMWTPRAVLLGHDDATREGSAAGFEGALAPHPRDAGGRVTSGAEAFLSAGGFPVWRLGGREVFAGSADGVVQLAYLELGENGLRGALLAADGGFAELELVRA